MLECMNNLIRSSKELPARISIQVGKLCLECFKSQARALTEPNMSYKHLPIHTLTKVEPPAESKQKSITCSNN